MIGDLLRNYMSGNNLNYPQAWNCWYPEQTMDTSHTTLIPSKNLFLKQTI